MPESTQSVSQPRHSPNASWKEISPDSDDLPLPDPEEKSDQIYLPFSQLSPPPPEITHRGEPHESVAENDLADSQHITDGDMLTNTPQWVVTCVLPQPTQSNPQPRHSTNASWKEIVPDTANRPQPDPEEKPERVELPFLQLSLLQLEILHKGEPPVLKRTWYSRPKSTDVLGHRNYKNSRPYGLPVSKPQSIPRHVTGSTPTAWTDRGETNQHSPAKSQQQVKPEEHGNLVRPPEISHRREIHALPNPALTTMKTKTTLPCRPAPPTSGFTKEYQTRLEFTKKQSPQYCDFRKREEREKGRRKH